MMHRLSRAQRGFLLVAACSAAAVSLGISNATRAKAAPQGKVAAVEARPDELDDVVEPLNPATKRSGREEDRVRALALFAAGRVAEQKQDYPKALRYYERAFRFDPQALAALREIVPLAFNLDRQEEAVRYALIMAERDPNDSTLLRRLAAHLAEEGDAQRALALYEKALALHKDTTEKPAAELVLLWMEMGRLNFLQKNFTRAAALFAHVDDLLAEADAKKLDPAVQKALLEKGELTYQLFGESYLEAGQLERAKKAFEKSQQLKADEATRLFNVARIDAKDHKPAQALAKLDEYCHKNFKSQGTAPYILLAEVLTQLGLESQLTAKLESYRAKDGENMALDHSLAQRYISAGQLDKAEAIYRAVFDRNQKRPPVEALQGLTEIYRRQADPAKLLEVLGEAAGRAGSFAPLGDAGKAVLADTNVARAVLQSAQKQLAETPDKLKYGQRLAAALVATSLKDYAGADALFAAALAAPEAKSSEVLVSWGLELFLAGQYDAAAKVFQRGLDEKILPNNNPSIYFYLAGALTMADRTEDALAAARKAAELQPDAARFASRVSWIEYHAKHYQAARDGYLKLLEKFDKDHESSENREVMREARLTLSNIAVLENKQEESEEWLEQVLDEFPEDVGALNDLGYVWTEAGKHLELALQMIETAVKQEPKNMAYRDSLGWAYYRLGRFDEAVAELKAAAAHENPDGVVLDHLAEAQLKAGDTAAAIENWQRAAEALTTKGEAEKAQAVRDKIVRAQAPAGEKAPSR